MSNKTNVLLWAVYLSLLAVLLPHTAWMFRQFEPPGYLIAWDFTTSDLISYVAAFAFEAAIAVLTHKIGQHIAAMPKSVKSAKGKWAWWTKFRYCYLNAYALGLIFATTVSAMANLAHAVQFGSEIAIFAQWGVPFGLYAVVFGAVLPLVSLTFARVLSNVSDTEDEEDPAVAEAKAEASKVRQALRESEAARRDAELRAQEAEARTSAVLDLAKMLFADNKRERIVAVKQQWPSLPNSAIAVMCEASESYVSETLKVIEV